MMVMMMVVMTHLHKHLHLSTIGGEFITKIDVFFQRKDARYSSYLSNSRSGKWFSNNQTITISGTFKPYMKMVQFQ